MSKTKVVNEMLQDAQETAQEAYSELVDVLVENGLMGRDKNFNHTLMTKMTYESWGADCPSPDTQFVVIQEFVERLSELDTADTLACIAACLKHADADNYVKSLEADDDLSKL